MNQPLTMTALSVLIWLAEPSRQRGEQPPEDILPRGRRARVHKELMRAGLIGCSSRYGVPYPFFITDEGRDRAPGARRALRRQQVQRHLLSTFEQELETSEREVLVSCPGGPATPREASDALAALRDKQLINMDSWEPPLFLPAVTNLGHTVLDGDYGPEFATHPRSAGATVNNTHYNINVTDSPSSAISTGTGNANSSGNTVLWSADQAKQLEAIDAFLAELRQTPSGEGGEEAHAALESTAEKLREKATSGTLDGVQEATKELATTATKAGLFGLLAQVPQIAQAFGLG